MSQQRHSTRARNVSVHVRLGQNALGPFVTAALTANLVIIDKVTCTPTA